MTDNDKTETPVLTIKGTPLKTFRELLPFVHDAVKDYHSNSFRTKNF